MKKHIKVIGKVALAIIMFGQSPVNAEDLRLTISRAEAPWTQTAVISWPGEPRSVYRVLFSTNLLDWKETVILETNSFLAPIVEGAGYFRVQKITPALTAANGNIPDSAILIAGSTGNYVAQYRFGAVNEGFTVDELKLKVPFLFALSQIGIAIEYHDRNGAEQRAYSFFVAGNDTNSDAIATFTGLTMYVPANGDGSVNVYLDTVHLSVSGFSGASGAMTLLANDGFSATGDSGSVITSAGSSNLIGNTFYIRKSKPTFAKLDAGTDPVNGPLYQFSVVADNAGNVDIKKLSFVVHTRGCSVTNLYLYDPNSSAILSKILPEPFGTTDITLNPNGVVVELPIGVVTDNPPFTDNRVVVVGTTPRILEFRATVTGYDQAGDSITVGFMQDVNPVTNGSVSELAGSGAYNVWSDRSASAHSVFTADWTNGYLLGDMDQVQTFNK